MGEAHKRQMLTCKCLLCGTVLCGNVADRSPSFLAEGSGRQQLFLHLILFKPVNAKQPILVAYIARRTGVEKEAVAETVESLKSTGFAFLGCRGGCPFSLMAQSHHTDFGLTLLHVFYSTVRRAQVFPALPLVVSP